MSSSKMLTALCIIATVLLLSTVSATTDDNLIVKVCAMNPQFTCSGNCTTYHIKSKQCFSPDNGQDGAFSFSCQAMPKCFDFTQYMGTTCTGGGGGMPPMNGTMPCNFCRRGEITTCIGENITQYVECSGDTCNPLSGCQDLFTAQLGKCTVVAVAPGQQAAMMIRDFRPCTLVQESTYKSQTCTGTPSISHQVSGECAPLGPSMKSFASVECQKGEGSSVNALLPPPMPSDLLKEFHRHMQKKRTSRF